MPFYIYDILDKKGKPIGEQFEIMKRMSDKALTKEPNTNRPCKRAIVSFSAGHSGPAWEWCQATANYINHMKPKYIRDDKTGIRKKLPKGGV